LQFGARADFVEQRDRTDLAGSFQAANRTQGLTTGLDVLPAAIMTQTVILLFKFS